MAVRRDQVQIDISFLTDESRQYAKLIESNKSFLKDIKAAKKEGKDLTGIIDDIAKSGQKLEDINLDNLTKPQLVTRAKQLKQVLDFIPKSAPQYKVLSKELQGVNTQLAKINRETKGVVTAANNMRTSFSGLASRLNVVVAAVTTVIGVFRGLGRSIGRAADFEQLNVAFETFLGDAEAAKKIIQELNDFSIRTPFEPEQVQQAGRALLAFGFEVDEITEKLEQIGNVAAGTGKDFNELTLIIGKAAAQGRVQGEELNQLAEAGIPIYEELGKVLGVNENQIRKLGEQGKIQFEDLEKVFENLTSEGGRFNGLIEKQSQTLTGLVSTARGAFGELSRTIGSAFLPLLKTILPPIINLINSLTNRIRPIADEIGGRLAQAFTFLQRIVSPVIEAFRNFFAQLSRGLGIGDLGTKIFQALGAVLTVLSNVLAFAVNQIAGFIGGIKDLAGESTILRNIVGFLIQSFTQLVATLNGVLSVGQFVFENLSNYAEIFRANLGLAFARIKGFFSDQATEIQRNENRLKQAYAKLGGSLGEAFRKGYENALQGGTAVSTGSETESSTSSGGGRAISTRSIVDGKAVEKQLQSQLKLIEANAKREEILLDRYLLQKEITASEHGKRLLQIERKQYEDQLALFSEFNQSQSSEAETARNRIIEINQTLNQASIAPLEEIGASSLGGVERRDINAELDRINSEEDQKLTLLREKFVQGILLEQEYDVLRLEAKQLALEQEIALLQQGSEAEVQEAARKQEELLKVETELSNARIENAEREKEAKKSISDAVIDTTQDALSAGIALLSQDEKARKKNASFIKAFESGKVITAGVKEVQDIWANSAKFGIAGTVLAAAQTAVAVARTSAALQKIQKTKFARGGSPKLGTFGGRPHSQGGTRGIFEDGTEIEVEKGENFYILNKNSSSAIRSLSAFNQMGGGVPLMRQGGSVYFQNGGVADINTNPTGISVASASAGGTAPDLSPLLEQVQSLSMAIATMPRTLTAKVVYDDYQEVETDVSTVRSASSIS